MQTKIDFTRVTNAANGAPRYVCHFLSVLTEAERASDLTLTEKYNLALARAKKIGGKKFHNRQYGGGIVFQSYYIVETDQAIAELLK